VCDVRISQKAMCRYANFNDMQTPTNA